MPQSPFDDSFYTYNTYNNWAAKAATTPSLTKGLTWGLSAMGHHAHQHQGFNSMMTSATTSNVGVTSTSGETSGSSSTVITTSAATSPTTSPYPYSHGYIYPTSATSMNSSIASLRLKAKAASNGSTANGFLSGSPSSSSNMGTFSELSSPTATAATNMENNNKDLAGGEGLNSCHYDVTAENSGAKSLVQ